MTGLWHFLVSHLFWLWISGVLLIPAGLELLWYYVVVLRAYDVGYDPAKCRVARPTRIDLAKALRRRVSWPLLGFPLYLIVDALFAVQNVFQSWTSYAAIGIGWFVTAPLRKMWGIGIARRIARRDGEPPTTSYWWDVATYYSWGFTFPSRPENEQWFVGKLKWLNSFQNLWYVLQFYRFWGVAVAGLASAFWPVVSVFSVFHHIELTDDYQRPWWRFDRSTRRAPRPVPASTVIDGETVELSRAGKG